MANSEGAILLKRARDLYQQGLPEQAEEIVGRLLRDNPRDVTALNFRAYLLYRRGSQEDAIAAYRRLAELEPDVPGHRANLGLICFKAHRYLEAQQAFERLLELQPGDAKTLRQLGFCQERQQSLGKALEFFTRAGDEQQAARIRERLANPTDGGAPAQPRPGLDGGAVAARFPSPQAVTETEVSAWLARASLPVPGAGSSLSRAGIGDLVVPLRHKVFVNPVFCVGHRGAVTFAAVSRDAEKSASKFGGRHGVFARAEGRGELVLSGLGGGLHALHLGGERLFVNWGALALCEDGITVSFDHTDLIKETFLAAELTGSGTFVLAIRGAPVVLSVAGDAPALVRPGSVVAWTEAIGYEAEFVPELKSLTGKTEALRYRFEGRGYLVLQPG
jgi:uncharacterized protein (AIM24 family)